ncbi:hypothetical protein KIPB_013079 [Kipferlia bialata]|uniref:Uncharacterized protein n=1 Tax=Kipferlia bialata TaxID=797122 RepID=A0A9K3GPE4_9EUKA|nr:hypothetical protein KIPB_013079 [Kipferlia bialata]|eukprot:g13079.t1
MDESMKRFDRLISRALYIYVSVSHHSADVTKGPELIPRALNRNRCFLYRVGGEGFCLNTVQYRYVYRYLRQKPALIAVWKSWGLVALPPKAPMAKRTSSFNRATPSRGRNRPVVDLTLLQGGPHVKQEEDIPIEEIAQEQGVGVEGIVGVVSEMNSDECAALKGNVEPMSVLVTLLERNNRALNNSPMSSEVFREACLLGVASCLASRGNDWESKTFKELHVDLKAMMAAIYPAIKSVSVMIAPRCRLDPTEQCETAYPVDTNKRLVAFETMGLKCLKWLACHAVKVSHPSSSLSPSGPMTTRASCGA